MIHAVELHSCSMIFLPSFMKFSAGVEAILRFFFNNLNVGNTDGKELRSAPF
jgi:hypothetical protein